MIEHSEFACERNWVAYPYIRFPFSKSEIPKFATAGFSNFKYSLCNHLCVETNGTMEYRFDDELRLEFSVKSRPTDQSIIIPSHESHFRLWNNHLRHLKIGAVPSWDSTDDNVDIDRNLYRFRTLLANGDFDVARDFAAVRDRIYPKQATSEDLARFNSLIEWVRKSVSDEEFFLSIEKHFFNLPDVEA